MAKSNDVYIDLESLKKGLYALEDTTKAPFGSARIMRNMRVTDRGGIAPRMGTELIGSENTSEYGSKGLFNFKKSFNQNEILLRPYGTKLEYLSKQHLDQGWQLLKDGFTADKEFGFAISLVNTDNEDYVVFCNRYEDYQRWIGTVTALNGALVGGETSVTVDSTLTPEIFESKTATSNSTTTLNVSGIPWAASQWVNNYVYIKNGTHASLIRKITANTSSQITFDALPSVPGNCDFEIRKLAFPTTGTLIYNGTEVAYTGIPNATAFTVVSAHAAPDNTPVTIIPEKFPANPRGNRFTNYLNRIIVGNVRSALARDAGGALQGFSSAGSYFVSKIADPDDFSFSATRLSGEGDIVGTPYGGGDITDVANQENVAYIFKSNYIEALSYSQDSNDLAQREPLKSGVGSVGRVIKGSDDIYFVTEDKKLTSIGRVKTKDVLPQTDNIGYPIKRLIDTYEFGEGRGIEDGDKIYFPAKESSDYESNNILIVYNKQNKSFDGIWDVSVDTMERFNNLAYFSDSQSPNVFKLNTGHADVVGTKRYGITSKYATHFFNLTGSNAYSQAMTSMYYEGYIKGGSTITFKAWKDFSNTPFLSFEFSGTESTFLDGSEMAAFLGGNPIGLRPIGSISEADPEGRRHFAFRVYFPFQYGNHFSVGFESSGSDLDYEVTRFGLGLAESVTVDTGRIKSI